MFQLIYDDLMYTRHCFDGKEGSEVGDGERPSSHGRESVDGVCVLARRRINRMPARVWERWNRYAMELHGYAFVWKRGCASLRQAERKRERWKWSLAISAQNRNVYGRRGGSEWWTLVWQLLSLPQWFVALQISLSLSHLFVKSAWICAGVC